MYFFTKLYTQYISGEWILALYIFCVSLPLIGKKDEKLVENGIILFIREKHSQIFRIEQILCPNKRKRHVFVL